MVVIFCKLDQISEIHIYNWPLKTSLTFMIYFSCLEQSFQTRIEFKLLTINFFEIQNLLVLRGELR